jgi:hypothetical protein
MICLTDFMMISPYDACCITASSICINNFCLGHGSWLINTRRSYFKDDALKTLKTARGATALLDVTYTQDSLGGRATLTETLSGLPARTQTYARLQHPDRAGLCALGEALCVVSREASPA